MIGQRLIGSHLTSFMLRSQREGLQVIAAMSASGRKLPVVTVRGFSSSPTCYPVRNGRPRQRAGVSLSVWPIGYRENLRESGYG